MNPRQGSFHSRMAYVVALLTKKPRTMPELERITGQTHLALSRYLAALEAEGLVLRGLEPPNPHKQGFRAAMWSWT